MSIFMAALIKAQLHSPGIKMGRLAFVCAAVFAASATANGPVPNASGLKVHEWGVFRANEDADFANADLRAEWDDLPPFVYGHIKGRTVPVHWGPTETRLRPIIFFHADKPLQVRARIDFPGGMAGVWFPATESPAVYGKDQKQPKIGGFLEWNLGVKQVPDGWQPKTMAPPDVSDKHWISRIRKVKSDQIFARYSQSPKEVERERFIYYDGLFPQGRWLKIAAEKDRVGLTSRVKHAVFDATIVDRRTDRIRIGRVAKIEAGETVNDVAFTIADASRFASDAADALVKQLIAAGLYEDESRSLVDLWKKQMFETPGLTVFYRIPQKEYDARMPLALTPTPDSVVRVGLIFHNHLEPDFAERVLTLAKQLDAASYADRESAMKKLLAIGPAALVQLQRLRERKDLSVEVRDRIDRLVKKWSAQEAFDR
jgi:hypothetical protein